MNKNRKIIIIVIIALCTVCSFAILFMNHSGSSQFAEVYVNNELYMTIDLSDKIYREYTIRNENGYNVIAVFDGAVCVSESDCPDKTCMKTGYTDSSAKPVICMPHRLQIVINDNYTDGTAG